MVNLFGVMTEVERVLRLAQKAFRLSPLDRLSGFCACRTKHSDRLSPLELLSRIDATEGWEHATAAQSRLFLIVPLTDLAENMGMIMPPATLEIRARGAAVRFSASPLGGTLAADAATLWDRPFIVFSRCC